MPSGLHDNTGYQHHASAALHAGTHSLGVEIPLVNDTDLRRTGLFFAHQNRS